ncbi:MAG TPA: phosphatidylglycerophosphatase A [Verrucomicrobiae bacterium]|nr:phosphatidylglycerophosphatase A [Verrucomicrobiae bacterium]
MRDRLVKFLATGFGIGYLPAAPGTAGSLVGVGFWWALNQTHHLWLRGLLLVLAVALAVWCAGAAAELMHHPDPPSVVIDEIVALPLAMIGLGAHWWHVVVAFALFRLFDIWKPPPVGDAESFSGGIGIVLDDLLAAAYACAGTHLVVYLVSLTRH